MNPNKSSVGQGIFEEFRQQQNYIEQCLDTATLRNICLASQLTARSVTHVAIRQNSRPRRSQVGSHKSASTYLTAIALAGMMLRAKAFGGAFQLRCMNDFELFGMAEMGSIRSSDKFGRMSGSRCLADVRGLVRLQLLCV